MPSERNHLHALVDALPEAEVQVAISFLSELGEEEIVDAETATKLDLARAEPGDDVPLEEVRRRIASSRHGSMRRQSVTLQLATVT